MRKWICEKVRGGGGGGVCCLHTHKLITDYISHALLSSHSTKGTNTPSGKHQRCRLTLGKHHH